MSSSRALAIESCANCRLRSANFFCDLHDDGWEQLQDCCFPAAYPRGAVLFLEGQDARGVFLLCRGRVKLTINSPDGRALIFKIAEPGEALGISAAVLQKPYALSAEALDPCQLNFIRRSDFLALLRNSPDATLRVAEQLGQEHQRACREISSLALAQSASEKLATLFLEWAAKQGRASGDPTHIPLTLTHEEIAQMIGTTRETVTRLLARFKRRQFIALNGSILELRDTASLAAVSSGQLDPR